MSSNNPPLQTAPDSGSFHGASDDLPASGTLVATIETTSAAPTGRWADEDKQEPANTAGAGLFCLDAPGGTSDAPQIEQQTPANAIKSRRDFEAFLRKSGFSRAASKAIAAGGWQAIGDHEADELLELKDMLTAQIEEMQQWTCRNSKTSL